MNNGSFNGLVPSANKPYLNQCWRRSLTPYGITSGQGPGLLRNFHVKIHVKIWTGGYWVTSMLNSTLLNNDFLTWLLIGWRLWRNLCQLTWILTWKFPSNPGLSALSWSVFPVINFSNTRFTRIPVDENIHLENIIRFAVGSDINHLALKYYAVAYIFVIWARSD